MAITRRVDIESDHRNSNASCPTPNALSPASCIIFRVDTRDDCLLPPRPRSLARFLSASGAAASVTDQVIGMRLPPLRPTRLLRMAEADRGVPYACGQRCPRHRSGLRRCSVEFDLDFAVDDTDGVGF